MAQYIPVNKLGMVMQMGGVKAEEVGETITQNKQNIMRKSEKRYVNEQGDDPVNSLRIRNKIEIRDMDVYREISILKSECVKMKSLKYEIELLVKRYERERNEMIRDIKTVKTELGDELEKLRKVVDDNQKLPLLISSQVKQLETKQISLYWGYWRKYKKD